MTLFSDNSILENSTRFRVDSERSATVFVSGLAGTSSSDPIVEVGGIFSEVPVQIESSLQQGRPDAWSTKLERQFTKLAEKMALQEASEAELQELQRLTAWRTDLNDSTPVDEILKELRKDVAVRELLSALKRYVKFR